MAEKSLNSVNKFKFKQHMRKNAFCHFITKSGSVFTTKLSTSFSSFSKKTLFAQSPTGCNRVILKEHVIFANRQYILVHLYLCNISWFFQKFLCASSLLFLKSNNLQFLLHEWCVIESLPIWITLDSAWKIETIIEWFNQTIRNSIL